MLGGYPLSKSKPKRGDFCRPSCPTQSHASYADCKYAAVFDAGWCSALLQLDNWIRSTIDPQTNHIKLIRSELISMFNDAHLEHLPVTKKSLAKIHKSSYDL